MKKNNTLYSFGAVPLILALSFIYELTIYVCIGAAVGAAICGIIAAIIRLTNKKTARKLAAKKEQLPVVSIDSGAENALNGEKTVEENVSNDAALEENVSNEVAVTESNSNEVVVTENNSNEVAVAESVTEEKPPVIKRQNSHVKEVDNATGLAIVVRYRKSFLARLILSSDETKSYYAALKNHVTTYKKLSDRISWNYESVNIGRKQLLKFNVRGKTLYMYFSFQSERFANTKYKTEPCSTKKYAQVPCLYKIKNGRRAKYAAELIDLLFSENGVAVGSACANISAADYTLQTTEELIKNELIKEVITKENYEEYLNQPDNVLSEDEDEVASSADEETDESEDEDEDDEDDEDSKDGVEGVDESTGEKVTKSLQKSFYAKLVQSENCVKEYYVALKNQVSAYKKISMRLSFNYDSVNFGRKKLLKFVIRGKTLCLYLATDPENYADTKYKVSLSSSKKYAEVPCLYKIKNDRRLTYAKELIAVLFDSYGLKVGESLTYFSAEDYGYKTNEELQKSGNIKEVVRKSDFSFVSKV